MKVSDFVGMGIVEQFELKVLDYHKRGYGTALWDDSTNDQSEWVPFVREYQDWEVEDMHVSDDRNVLVVYVA